MPHVKKNGPKICYVQNEYTLEKSALEDILRRRVRWRWTPHRSGRSLISAEFIVAAGEVGHFPHEALSGKARHERPAKHEAALAPLVGIFIMPGNQGAPFLQVEHCV